MPIGMNAAATAKNMGITLRAVRIGCHAGSRCCLKAVSVTIQPKRQNINLCKYLLDKPYEKCFKKLTSWFFRLGFL